MTKFKYVLAALALAFMTPALSACSTLANLTDREQVATYDERALLTAELAYGFVLQTIEQAAALGLIDRDEALALQPVITEAREAILRARRAYAAGSELNGAVATQNAVAQIAAALRLLEEFGLVTRNGA